MNILTIFWWIDLLSVFTSFSSTIFRKFLNLSVEGCSKPLYAPLSSSAVNKQCIKGFHSTKRVAIFPCYKYGLFQFLMSNSWFLKWIPNFSISWTQRSVGMSDFTIWTVNDSTGSMTSPDDSKRKGDCLIIRFWRVFRYIGNLEDLIAI